MTAGLNLQGLTVQVGAATLLKDVDLAVDPGGFVAIVGPNGAGKSTLLKAALGLVRTTAGELSVDGQALGSLSGRARAGVLAWLPQRDASVESVRVVDRVAAARFRFSEGRGHSLHAAHQALEALGIAGLAERRVDTLSGGEAQRVALAGLAAQEATWWLLDEPAHHLDPGRQVEVYRTLGARWRGEFGAPQSMIAVTHDVNLLSHAAPGEWADRLTLIGLSEGTVRFRAPLSDPTLAEQLSVLFETQVKAVSVEGARHFVVTGGAS
jgi:iron complex transport system ATP-binding protein